MALGSPTRPSVVVHVWDGRFYRFDAHLDRFAASLATLRLDPGHDRAEIEAFGTAASATPGCGTPTCR